MTCCCSLAGTKACESCRNNTYSDYKYVSTQPIIDFRDNELDLSKLIKNIKVGDD